MKSCRLFLFFCSLSFLNLNAPAQNVVPVKGTYYGVFFETNGAWSHSSGSVVLSTTSRGSYTANLQRGHDFYRYTSHFDENGADTTHLVFFSGPSLTVTVQIDAEDPDVITGSVSDGHWVADLSAYRSVFDTRTNICPAVGKYTMILPGDVSSSSTPGGDGFATIKIDKAGRISASGELGDTWGFFQSTHLSKDGQWPFYVAPYGGRGTLHGLLQVNAPDSSAISGDLTWVKRNVSWDWYYPDGFSLTVATTGSLYVQPAKGTPIIPIDNGVLTLDGGNLRDTITNNVSIDGNSQIHNDGPNDLSMKFSLSSGFFKGFIADPHSWDWIPFRGVVLQDRGIASGYFFGWDQTGEVLLQNAPGD